MSSSLRERQREMTRELIIDAVAQVVNEQGAHSFSMDEVATRAGVSLRTLYRYFPSRAELLSAVPERLTEFLLADGEHGRGTLDQHLEILPRRFAVLSEHEALARATVALITLAEQGARSGDLSAVARDRNERHQALREAMDADLPEMSEESVRQIFAVGRLLGSIVGWSNLTGHPGNLSPESAGVAVRWALKTLMVRARELQSAGVHSFEEDLV